MMANPDTPNHGPDMPIRCWYCEKETTISKIVTSPDGHPCCVKCYNEKFRKDFTYGDLKDLI